MKPLYILLLLLLSHTGDCSATASFRSFVVGNFFFGDDSCGTRINCAIRVEKYRIVFAGHSDCNSQGNIPAASAQQKGSNIIVGKLDSSYNTIWIKIFGGDDSLTEQAKAICYTRDGGYAILSTTGSANGSITSYYGGDDIWLLKLDSNGNTVFQKNIGSAYNDKAVSIAETATGDLLILGVSNGSGNDIPAHYGNNTTNDWVLIKTDSGGIIKWAKNIGGSNEEGAEGSILAIDTNYFIASNSNSTDHDCDDTSWFGGANTGFNYHLLKLDTAGIILWDRSYGGSDTDKAVTAIWSLTNTILLSGYAKSADSMVHDNTYKQKTGWLVETNLNGDIVNTISTIREADKVYGMGSSVTMGLNEHYSMIPVVANGVFLPNNTTDKYRMQMCYSQSYYSYTTKFYTFGDWIASIIPLGPMLYALSGSTIKTDTANAWKLNKGDKGFISIINYGWYGSVNDVHAGIDLKAYPNPFTNRLQILLNEKEQGAEYRLYNVTGQTKLSGQITGKTTTIDATHIPVGMYILEVKNAEGMSTREKVVKVE